MPASQDTRNIQISSSLGPDVLLFYRMAGSAALSELGEFELDLLSDKSDLAINDILGLPLSVKCERTDGDMREFNGIVTRFALTGRKGRYATYQATVRPWLWFLTRVSDCFIFQEKTVVEIIKAIFDKYSFADVDLGSLSGTYAALPYCVQYRETDFAFVSRLMERFGIYYFFKHAAGRHTLVLADAYTAHSPIEGRNQLAYVPDDQSGRRVHEVVYEFNTGGEILSDQVALRAFDFEKPTMQLSVKTIISHTYGADAGSLEVYDYPGRFLVAADGDAEATVRARSIQTGYQTVQGRATSPGMAPGGLFNLEEHPRVDQNGELLVLRAQYRLHSDLYQSDQAVVTGQDAGTRKADQRALSFDCRFTALAKEFSFRPPQTTSLPIVRGPQTAIVVGKAGEEIWTDKYGRIKVQFHWDRVGADDEGSSCWVRVAQGWAGKRWGQLFIPRIGQEVIVSFLEGDPDQPLVTGSVYNGDNMPPVTLPENASRSTMKSNSTKGGEGFNELRFEDKKGSEQVFMHAQKDHAHYVKNDLHEWIGNEQHQIVVKDKLEDVGGDKGSKIGGDASQKVGGTVSVDAGADVMMKAAMNIGMDGGMDIHIKAGMNLVLEAGMSITLKAGGGSIVIGPASVAITGTPVLLNSGGSPGSGAGTKVKAPKEPKQADDGSK